MAIESNTLQEIKILYVENDQRAIEQLVAILSTQTNRIIAEDNGQKGFDAYLQEHPDLIITDIKMPVMDGLTMIKKIRQVDDSIPIVIITAFDDVTFLKTSIELHVDQYISKPINPLLLLSILNKLASNILNDQKLEKKNCEIQLLQKLLSQAVLYTTSDLDGNITMISKAFEEFSGYREEELIGKNHSIFRLKDTPDEFYAKLWETLKKNREFKGELQNHKKSGDIYWARVTIYPMFDEEGIKIGYGSYREDITDKKTLEYLSNHDRLTNSYNRGYFHDQLHKKINLANRYQHNFGLVMFDIDHFKVINDTHGHQVGDKVLKKLTYGLQQNMREDDILARWGGEEFMVIVNGSDLTHLVQFVQKLQKRIADIDFSPVKQLSVSFGITLYEEGDDTQSIQKRVDDALYRAKNNGRDRYEIQ